MWKRQQRLMMSRCRCASGCCPGPRRIRVVQTCRVLVARCVHSEVAASVWEGSLTSERQIPAWRYVHDAVLQVHDSMQFSTSFRGCEQQEAPASPRSAAAAAQQRAEILAAVKCVRERAAGLVTAAAALPQAFRPEPGELLVDEALVERLAAEGVTMASTHSNWLNRIPLARTVSE